MWNYQLNIGEEVESSWAMPHINNSFYETKQFIKQQAR